LKFFFTIGKFRLAATLKTRYNERNRYLRRSRFSIELLRRFYSFMRMCSKPDGHFKICVFVNLFSISDLSDSLTISTLDYFSQSLNFVLHTYEYYIEEK
ncbi:hypothetical protein L9F63_007056, partial [Diploptera punctata]